MVKKIPVFVISYNRGVMLRDVINSYHHLSTPIEIIIHDNGSDDLETVGILKDLEKDGIKVFRQDKISSPKELNLVDHTVSEFFSGDEPSQNYVVTDCDIDMSSAQPDALDVYQELLNVFPQAECVGPMLRISDIPSAYPLFNRVMNRHISQFWGKSPLWRETLQGKIFYQHATIDTTFAVHRKGAHFRRMKAGIRVYEPYEAKHLDWYLTDILGDYHSSSSKKISHWNNALEFKKFRKNPLKFFSYKVVKRNKKGGLFIVTKSVQYDNPRKKFLGIF